MTPGFKGEDAEFTLFSHTFYVHFTPMPLDFAFATDSEQAIDIPMPEVRYQWWKDPRYELAGTRLDDERAIEFLVYDALR